MKNAILHSSSDEEINDCYDIPSMETLKTLVKRGLVVHWPAVAVHGTPACPSQISSLTRIPVAVLMHRCISRGREGPPAQASGGPPINWTLSPWMTWKSSFPSIFDRFYKGFYNFPPPEVGTALRCGIPEIIHLR